MYTMRQVSVSTARCTLSSVRAKRASVSVLHSELVRVPQSLSEMDAAIAFISGLKPHHMSSMNASFLVLSRSG